MRVHACVCTRVRAEPGPGTGRREGLMVLEGLGSWNRQHHTDGRTNEKKQGNKSEEERKEGGWKRGRQEMKRETRRRGSQKKKENQTANSSEMMRC